MIKRVLITASSRRQKPAAKNAEGPAALTVDLTGDKLSQRIATLLNDDAHDEEKYREGRRLKIAKRYADAREIYRSPDLFETFLAQPNVNRKKCDTPLNVLEEYFKLTYKNKKIASKDRRSVDAYWPESTGEEVFTNLSEINLQEPGSFTIPASLIPEGHKLSKGAPVAIMAAVVSIKKSGSVVVAIKVAAASQKPAA